MERSVGRATGMPRPAKPARQTRHARITKPRRVLGFFIDGKAPNDVRLVQPCARTPSRVPPNATCSHLPRPKTQSWVGFYHEALASGAGITTRASRSA